ncbi:glucose 1-dehydrogenase [Chloroflexota bacterium]
MNRVSGKVIIVTGAASGLGKAIAILLAKEGAKLIATDVSEVQGRTVVEEIKRSGGIAAFIRQDVAQESEWEKVIETTLRDCGRLDVLVNCAGVFVASSIADLTLEQWRWLMSINLDGVFLGIKYAAEAMRKTNGGSIINMSSAGGIVGTSDSSAYNASKGGVRLLSKAAAIEFSKRGHDYNIRVNSVHPGVVETPMTAPLINDPLGGADMKKWVPVGHFGEPVDVAYGVLYLASDESRFVTGSELVIDGGWTAQ